jgi:hypothetical protein
MTSLTDHWWRVLTHWPRVSRLTCVVYAVFTDQVFIGNVPAVKVGIRSIAPCDNRRFTFWTQEDLYAKPANCRP